MLINSYSVHGYVRVELHSNPNCLSIAVGNNLRYMGFSGVKECFKLAASAFGVKLKDNTVSIESKHLLFTDERHKPNLTVFYMLVNQ